MRRNPYCYMASMISHYKPKKRAKEKTRPAAEVDIGTFTPAALFAVDEAWAAVVVYVLVFGSTVVPGIIEAGSVVAGWTVLVPTILGSTVSAAIVEGGTVVPGIVVVTVSTWPRAVAGIALPTPVPVN